MVCNPSSFPRCVAPLFLFTTKRKQVLAGMRTRQRRVPTSRSQPGALGQVAARAERLEVFLGRRAAPRKRPDVVQMVKRYWLDNLQEGLSFRPFAPEDTDLHDFQAITRALQERRVLEFQYKNLGAAKVQRRMVHPYHLACIENHWYLFAFDVDRQAMRTFSLSRLTGAKMGSQKFEPAEELQS